MYLVRRRATHHKAAKIDYQIPPPPINKKRSIQIGLTFASVSSEFVCRPFVVTKITCTTVAEQLVCGWFISTKSLIGDPNLPSVADRYLFE